MVVRVWPAALRKRKAAGFFCSLLLFAASDTPLSPTYPKGRSRHLDLFAASGTPLSASYPKGRSRHLDLFAACDTPLSPTATSPLTGATYSQNLRNDSTSNKLSLSGRDAEPARQRGYLLPSPSFCNAYYTFCPKFAAGKLPICGLRLKPALYDVKRCFL